MMIDTAHVHFVHMCTCIYVNIVNCLFLQFSDKSIINAVFA